MKNFKFNLQQLLFVTTFFLMLFSCKAQQKFSNSNIAKLDAQVESIFTESDIPGLTAVVINSEGLLYSKSMGYSDIATKTDYTEHTLQPIASISKTFLALVLMKAVEDGKVDLDEDINTYLPFKVSHPKYTNEPITLRHLSSHTSGINDGEVYERSYLLKDAGVDLSYLPKDEQAYFNAMKGHEQMDESDFLERILTKNGSLYSHKNFTKKAPGARYHYSNVGATLAGYVIENAVEVKYEDYVRQVIFEPLGMTETSWYEELIDSNALATKYLNGEGIVIPEYELITKADGAIVTSSHDFTKYLQEMLRGYQGKGTLLTPDSYKTLFTRKVYKKGACGIFWDISVDGYASHNGGDPGVFANTEIKPKKNIGVFIMTNGTIDMGKVFAIWGTLHNYPYE